MLRINTANKAIDLFGAGKHGWRDGAIANGIEPTEFEAAFLNAVQEEIANFIEASGMALDAANNGQLRSILRVSWSVITAARNAVIRDALMCDTIGGAFTVTLPAAPAANDMVRFADYSGTFATNNLTIGRNGKKIMGLAENMVVGNNNVSIVLTYIDAVQGWRVTV